MCNNAFGIKKGKPEEIVHNLATYLLPETESSLPCVLEKLRLYWKVNEFDGFRNCKNIKCSINV